MSLLTVGLCQSIPPTKEFKRVVAFLWHTTNRRNIYSICIQITLARNNRSFEFWKGEMKLHDLFH